jgi:diguanylate cyclase (GGDEF)-like protein/PAS domain S-box-containing protein
MPWPAFGALGLLAGAWLLATAQGHWRQALLQVAGLWLLLAGGAFLMSTGRKVLETSAALSERLRHTAEADLKSYFDILPLGALSIGRQGQVLLYNAKSFQMLGLSEEHLRSLDWRAPSVLVVKADGNTLEPSALPMNEAMATGRSVAGMLLGVERVDDGNFTWLSVSAQPRFGEAGRVRDVICILEDVTERRSAEVELTLLTFRDRLTGLPNRALFMERLSQAVLRSDRRKFFPAVLFLDLDRFKVVNDSLSHEAGDQLLMQVARRLRGCLRPEDTVARLGGDEFVVLFEDILTVSDGLLVADRISQGLMQPFLLDGQEVYTTCSMGIAISASADAVPSELVRDAEVAMYRAKAKGKGSIEIFDPSMNAQALARFQMDSEMRRALERAEFVLHYQPLVNLKSGLIEGWEALVRWQHPERGLVPPLDFISLAEETGLIVPLGQWVLEAACLQAGLWQEQFPCEPARLMNVNISGRQFGQGDLIATVLGALAASTLSPPCLKLEITESVMMRDPHASLEAMKIFRSKGIHLVIDDFGTGYSSLSYLKRFPVDTLKIDKSFVDGLGKDPESTAIVTAVISLAQSLGMRVTAEGIETEDQMLHLRALGCDQGQGYFFSRPLPRQAAEALLHQHPKW